jgi:putative membrane protein
MFSRTLLAIALVAASGVALAQTTPNANQPSGTAPPGGATMPRDAAPATPPATQMQQSSPLATEGLAKSKIEASGYTDVKDLTKNADGTWSAKAMKDNQEIAVSVDAQGNVMSK